MTIPAPSGGDRVITGAQIRAARGWLTARAALLADWTCAERTLATVGVLLTDPFDSIVVPDLMAALRDVDTVDVALDLLTDTGLGCA